MHIPFVGWQHLLQPIDVDDDEDEDEDDPPISSKQIAHRRLFCFIRKEPWNQKEGEHFFGPSSSFFTN